MLEGLVIEGDRRGRQLGFPTANLRVDEACIGELPRGVYVASVSIAGASAHRAVVNIGARPTFAGASGFSVEAHLLDFAGDLYGEALRVVLGRRLREERRFDSVEELQRQIGRDIESARAEEARDQDTTPET